MASSVTAFACLLCNYSSDRKSNLESHVRTIHEKVKEHACDLCSYRSSRKGNVVQHRKTVHEGKKDFVCGLCTFKSSRKFNLNQHVERVHKGQQQLALNPQVQQIKIESAQVRQDPHQQLVVQQQPQDQHPPLQIIQQQQQQQQQHHPFQIQLQSPQQQTSPPQIQTISLNPPTMVGGLQNFKIEPVAVPVSSQQQQQQTVTASLVMQPPKPGQTGPPVFTLNFPSQPVPVQQQQHQQQQQQQQVHVQQVHVQQVQPLTVTVKRKTPKTHDCKFCNYKTSKEKNLRIHLEAIHPGLSNVAVPTVSNQVPTVAVPSQPAFPTHAVSGIDHFLSASAVSSNSTTPVAMPGPGPAAVTTVVHTTPTSPIAQPNIHVLAPHPQQPVQLKSRSRANAATAIAKAADWRKTRGRVFTCDRCPFTTAYERNLKAHVKEVHLKEKRVHSCHICNRFKSSRRSNLSQHIRTIHDGIKDFSCALCDFQSSRKRSLEKHAANAHGMNR